MATKRSLSEPQKKIVAARQAWKCVGCTSTLPSTFQVDHIVPLWAGGASGIINCQAFCPNCHATKTQHESIERAARERSRREEVVLAAREKGRRKERLRSEPDDFGTNPFAQFAYLPDSHAR